MGERKCSCELGRRKTGWLLQNREIWKRGRSWGKISSRIEFEMSRNVLSEASRSGCTGPWESAPGGTPSKKTLRDSLDRRRGREEMYWGGEAAWLCQTRTEQSPGREQRAEEQVTGRDVEATASACLVEKVRGEKG